MFLGMAIGPALGGWISGASDSPVPVFYISCVSHFLKMAQQEQILIHGIQGLRILAILLLAFVPESLSDAVRLQDKAASSLTGHPLGRRGTGVKHLLRDLHPRQILDVLLPSSKLAGRPLRVNLVCLASINTLMFGCAMGSMSILMLYPQVGVYFLMPLHNFWDGVILCYNPSRSYDLRHSHLEIVHIQMGQHD